MVKDVETHSLQALSIRIFGFRGETERNPNDKKVYFTLRINNQVPSNTVWSQEERKINAKMRKTKYNEKINKNKHKEQREVMKHEEYQR